MYFFFNDTATTEIYTLSLHDALPIYAQPERSACIQRGICWLVRSAAGASSLSATDHRALSAVASELRRLYPVPIGKAPVSTPVPAQSPIAASACNKKTVRGGGGD